MKSQRIHLPLLFIVLGVIAAAGILGLSRLKIDTDIAKSLPAGDPIVADALEIFNNHPMHDQVAVDIMIHRQAPDILVSCANLLEQRMRASGLFAEVGMGDMTRLIPEVARQVAGDLPMMFSAKELERQVAPRLLEKRVTGRLHQLVSDMTGLSGIGQSAYIALDPLGLKDLVLARLIHLAPSHNGRIYKNHLISADGKHLLLIAQPTHTGSNTKAARKLVSFFDKTGKELNAAFAPSGFNVVLTPTGSYRAALDNEEIIRHDVKLALGLSTVGIALMLMLAFPRPLLSLVSLIPPLVGITMALFTYSLFHNSISIMVLGFSGALISVMDDYSITYLLFLDRPQATKGKKAACEVAVNRRHHCPADHDRLLSYPQSQRFSDIHSTRRIHRPGTWFYLSVHLFRLSEALAGDAGLHQTQSAPAPILQPPFPGRETGTDRRCRPGRSHGVFCQAPVSPEPQ